LPRLFQGRSELVLSRSPLRSPSGCGTLQKAEAGDGAVEVELAERVKALRVGALPVEHPPSLYRINGIGTTLLGHYFDRDFAPAFYTVHFFTLLWIPIIPLGIYMVKHPVDESGRQNPDRYQFLWRIPADLFDRIYPNGRAKLVGTSIVQTLFWIAGIAAIIFLLVIFKMGFRHIFR
jgi:hypothetical protein